MMRVSQFFYEHPVFRHEEFANWKSAKGEIKPGSVNNALGYYVKTGKIILIRRGLYAVVPANQTSENTTVDPYLIASKATEDAVLGYHTVLELLGVAYSAFGQFTYITEQKSKPFGFQGHWFQSVAVPAVLKHETSTEYPGADEARQNSGSKRLSTSVGIEHIERQGVLLKVTSPARTFVDVLNRVELCGGWEEVCRSIQNFAMLNIDEAIDYCLRLNNLRLNATVGYFLSLRTGAFAVSKKQLAPLLNAVPKTPQYASKRLKMKNNKEHVSVTSNYLSNQQFQLIKPWNILLPLFVINQTWEEPDVDI